MVKFRVCISGIALHGEKSVYRCCVSLRGEEMAVLTRFEPPLDLVIKRLHTLNSRLKAKDLAYLLGVHRQTLWNWLGLRHYPKRSSCYGAVILSLCSDHQLRQAMRELQTLPGARYVDRTKRKRVPKVAPAEDYSI
jgi:hypothetical protein